MGQAKQRKMEEEQMGLCTECGQELNTDNYGDQCEHCGNSRCKECMKNDPDYAEGENYICSVCMENLKDD